jgi:hypothetical protein
MSIRALLRKAGMDIQPSPKEVAAAMIAEDRANRDAEEERKFQKEIESAADERAKKARRGQIINLACALLVVQSNRGIHPMEDGNWKAAVSDAEWILSFIENGPEEPPSVEP